MPDGSLRDSAYFSVISPEWPAVKARLRAGLRLVSPNADPVVLDRDMLAAGPSATSGRRSHSTVVGGEVVHQTEGFG